MDIVVDASVIIAVIANEAEKDKLVKLTQGASLVAPPSVHWEIGNAFSAMLKRSRITLHQALKATQAYHRIPIRFAEVELDEALRIAAESNIYSYDAYLIRCALKYNAPLISLDKELVKVAQENGASVIEVGP
jgi:predicted nucleic acid-binding protein